MNKQEFLNQLRSGLNGLPHEEIEERVMFYSEMIDDRVEEGLSEEDAIRQIGPIDSIVSQTVLDVPLTKYVKEKLTPKRKISAWEIVLLVLGSPIWLSLLIAFFVVIFSAYIVLWSLVISLWAVFVSLVVCAFCGVLSGIAYAVCGHGFTGFAVIGAALICGGISIFLFYGCKGATKGSYILLNKFLLWIKRHFIKKEEM
ncbi:MAG: DUF1700 domain-containing protein [Lachnospiraceae bacterium]|nr:DUF1700 domain-containing protein [Lachnospiraceae bacterium]